MSMAYSMVQFSDFIREYQIAQTDIDKFTVRVVPSIPITDAEKHRILQAMRAHYPDATIIVQAVQKLVRTPAAKLKQFVSELPATLGSGYGN